MNKSKGLNLHIKPENRGTFTTWCKRRGFTSGSAQGCIDAGKKSKLKAIRKKAIFAQNFAK